MTISPMGWVSDSQAHAELHDLLPLQELFSTPAYLQGTDEISKGKAHLWQLQSSLLLRFAIARGQRQELWNFVARSAADPVTESMFQECFGISSATMQRQLAAYLPQAMQEPFVLDVSGVLNGPPIEMRDATEQEIACAQINFGRKEVEYVSERYPDRARSYIDQIDSIVLGVRDQETRFAIPPDPALEAAIGLYYAVTGRSEAARKPLEAAVSAGSSNPSVYAELAKIRFAQAKAKPASISMVGWFSTKQVASIVDLFTACPDSLMQLRSSVTIVDTLNQADRDPSQENLALLDQGMRYFPNNAGFILASARLYFRAGRMADVKALVDRGLAKATDPTVKSELQALRQQTTITKGIVSSP